KIGSCEDECHVGVEKPLCLCRFVYGCSWCTSMEEEERSSYFIWADADFCFTPSRQLADGRWCVCDDAPGIYRRCFASRHYAGESRDVSCAVVGERLRAG